MARSVFLIDPDLESLGALASRLRSRGFQVTIADGQADPVERARSARPEVLLVAATLPTRAALESGIRDEPELAKLPRFLLVETTSPSTLPSNQLPRGDTDIIVQRLLRLPGRTAQPIAGEKDDFRGDLEQLGVVDLLQMLTMNRRSGVLSVVTGSGSGEVRLADGEVVDAVYRRLEGEKALFRLLGERQGSFAFAGGKQTAMNRVGGNTSMLIMDGLRQLDEVAALRERLDLEQALLVAPPLDRGDLERPERHVLEAIAEPRALDDVLDEVALADLQILRLVEALLSKGLIEKVTRRGQRPELAPAEQLAVLGAVASRLRTAGFEGSSRLVVAGSHRRLAVLRRAFLEIAHASEPKDAPPAAPVPHLAGSIALGDDATLEVLLLPDVETMAPLWALALPGSSVAIRLDARKSDALEGACAISGVPVFDAEALMGWFDESDAEQVAALVREALGAVAGD